MAAHDPHADGWQLDKAGPEAYEEYLVPGMFAPWADVLVERAKVGEGDRVLDLACGTGIVARRAVPPVGERGSVVGVDVNEGMLEVARAVSDGTEPPIDWREGDATELPFPDGSFDVVLCQQALQFFSAPRAALEEVHRVLATDGRLACNVWRPLKFNGTYAVMAEALEEHVSTDAATLMRSPFPEWDTTTLRSSVRAAGFTDVLLTIEIGSMRYPSVEEFLRREVASSPLAGPLGELAPDARAGLIEDLADRFDGYVDDQGLVYPMETYVVTGRP